MIEIIPNWHPVFAHFTVGLLSISSLLFVVGVLAPATAAWKEKCLIVARWNLWMGAIITIGTVLAGWQAYNTVAHDGPSHAAMTDHRNWALVTATLFMALGLWAFISRKTQQMGAIFILLIIVAAGLLATTGFKGGEAVYRYGLGVLSLPEVSRDGGHGSHDHSDEGHGPTEPVMSDGSEDDHGNHDH